MKLFLCVLALAAVVACTEIDLQGIQRRDIRIPLPFAENILREPRIVGGQEAVPNSIGHKVALLISTAAGTFFCGGSILSPGTVLTAAHCVEGATQVQVIAGAHSPMQSELTQQRLFTSSFTIHPGWNSATLVNDIAVIHIPTPLVFNANVWAASLPSRSQIGNSFAGQSAIVSGWGLEADTSNSISEVLRWVEVNVIANLICNIAFLGIIQGSHVCTSGSEGRGPCSGDSGGCLALSASGECIGIVSFGIALGCELGWPTAFTRNTLFLDWIEINSDVTIS